MHLIDYLLDKAPNNNFTIRLGDYSLDLAREKSHGVPFVEAFQFDILNHDQTDKEVKNADLVISMLPAQFHIILAQKCLEHGTNMATASYITDPLQALYQEAKNKGITILMECGLDPGLDHMSAMRVIDQHRKEGFSVHTFETFTGGLLAPAENHNPWEYKFTWNPRNVILAGNGAVKFIQEGRYKYIPYHRLFRRTEIIHIPGHGYFEGYANRDSLKYKDVYGLQGIKTLYRGTLRRPGFCKAWDVFVQLGATDDSYEIEGVEHLTHRQFINLFLSYNPSDSVELKIAHYMGLELDSEIMYKLKWLGIFDETPIGLSKGTPAQILEHMLKKKWSLEEHERDMIVMWHKFVFEKDDVQKEMHSHMIVTGNDRNDTGMSKTVGLPLGIAALMILQGKIKTKGVIAPIYQDVYEPILNELENYDIIFQEKEVEAEVKI